MEDYWDNSLVIIGMSGNPRIVWGTYPESVDLAGYNIYRKVGSGSFNLIHYNYETQLDFIDTDYNLTQTGGNQLQYYIKAVYTSEKLSSSSNTVTTQGIIILKNGAKNDIYIKKNHLSVNYPNPFNPVTKIYYSVPQNDNVTLRIYDCLGHDICTLINEFKTCGTYSIEFDASNLSSGVYFYRIQIGNNNETRKLILQK